MNFFTLPNLEETLNLFAYASAFGWVFGPLFLGWAIGYSLGKIKERHAQKKTSP